MKLGKSKLALAKVINENGGWHGSDVWLFSTQSGDGVLKFLASKPKALKGCVCTEWSGGCRLNFALSRVIKNWHQTILSREEYYQAYPKADADGWIERIKSAQQADGFSVVDVRFRDGGTAFGPAHVFDWSVDGGEDDIIAYRLHKPEAKPEFCESVMRTIPEPEAKPSIEQLAADYRNAKDYADRKQQEADDAKVDADSKLKALELAGEAIGLTVSPITERQAPELVITDWRQWLVGDVVSWSLLNHAVEFEIISVHHDQSRNIGDFEVKDKQGGVYRVYGNECRFIRRP